MTDQKRTRLFIRNPDSGEPWAYCGELPLCPKTRRALSDFVANEIDADFGGAEGDRFSLEVKRVEMTDAEVEAIPEM